MNVIDILQDALRKNASDIFFISGSPYAFRINDSIIVQDAPRMMPADMLECVAGLYALKNASAAAPELRDDDDFSFSVPNLGRFRANIYKQRGSYGAVLRIVRFELPNPEQLGIPPTITELYKKKKGLILVTGSAGSGKSTTLSCIVDKINTNRNAHIITIEDPIEYIHSHKQSLVSQREVVNDTESYLSALRAALRQSPNVILLGEMRDFETISTVMTAAETGQLLLSTLHTVGAANTVDRIIDVFPHGQQQQIRMQLSMVLEAVVSQQLIPSTDGKLVPAFEIMLVNSAIRKGMVTMDASILRLYEQGVISGQNALLYCSNYEFMSKKIKV